MLGLGQAAQNAMNVVWAVPRNSRFNPFTSRVRSLLLLVLGGITVLTHLSPATVAAHFLVSAVIIVASFAVLDRLRRTDGEASWTVRVEVQWLGG